MSKVVEALSGELDIFSPPVVQTGIMSGDWIQFKPVQTISQDSPLVFNVAGSGDKYVDMSRTLLQIKCQVLKEDGSKYAATDTFSLVNNVLGSLFADVIVEFNQTTVSQSHQMYHIKSYLQNLFNYNNTAKDTHLTSAIFYQDNAGKFDDLTAEPLKKRFEFFKGSKEVELFGRVHADVLNSNRYMLNNIDMRFTFVRNPCKIVCMAAKDMTPRVVITDATLHVRKIDISPAILVAHSKILQNNTAKYPFNRVDMFNYTISQGVSNKNLENLFGNRIPSRIIIGLVKNSSFTGNYETSVFNFEHFNLNYLNFSINGKTVGAKPYMPNYTTGEYMLPFIGTFYGVGIQTQDDGFCVGRTDFANGFNLIAYDLNGDLSANESHWNLQREGSMRLELGFKEALDVPVSVIIYVEQRELLEVDRNRQCALTYKP